MPKVVAALARLIPGHRGADRVPQHLQRESELRELACRQIGREEPQVGADVFNRPAETLVTRQVVHGRCRRGERRGLARSALASDDAGAVRPVTRARPETWSCASVRPDATWLTRAPYSPRPYRRTRSVRTPLSSRNTRRAGSRVGATACHAVRATATSARSCSDARTVFFKPEPELLDRAAQRRETGGGPQRRLQFGQRAVRLFVDQRRELVQLRVQDRRPPPGLPAWCDLTGIPAPLFSGRSTQARLTAYFSATSWDGMPASESRNTRSRKIH